MKNHTTIICKNCGEKIPKDEIEIENKCNDEGEDYSVVSAYCDTCGEEYETSQWGEFETKDDAIEVLSEYIKDLPDTTTSQKP